MGREKEAIIIREQAQYDAAERANRRCPYCSSVIPFGTHTGKHGECGACASALKDD